MKHIAILDDSATLTDMMKFALEYNGHQATAFHTGRDLLQIMRTVRFDGAIIDLHLPGLTDGIATIQEARQLDSEMPILVMTGSGEALIRRAQQIIPDIPIMQKPFHVAQLLDWLKEPSQQQALTRR